MARLKWLCGIGIVLIFLIVGGVLFVEHLNTAQFLGSHADQPTAVSIPTGDTFAPGLAAIAVHSTDNGNTSGTGTSATPAFGSADVTSFLNKHGFYSGPLIKGAHLKIVKLQFMTVKQASKLMSGESIGRPDNYLVCYVQVQGPFQLIQPNPVPGKSVPPMTIKTGSVVFDSQTGNMLVWGVDG